MKRLVFTLVFPLLLAGSTLRAGDAATSKAHPAASRLSFAKAITIPTALSQPTSIAVGDLSRSGFPALAVVSAAGPGNFPYVSYALGRGNGRFGSWQGAHAARAPLFVLLADATGNRTLDAVTTDVIHNETSIAYGDGKGGFPSYVDINNISGAVLAVADVNRDGIPDIVGSGGGPNNVFVILGEGKKKFGQPTVYPSGGDNPNGVAVGDLRHNGIRDLVVANNGALTDGSHASVGVLLGNGDGTFQNPVAYKAGPRPFALVLGDFNGDGNLDVAVCGYFGVHVLLGKGDGTFSSAKGYTAGQNPDWIVAADFNGDGKLDLAVANDRRYVSVLLGNGDGTFQKPRKFGVGVAPWQLVVADFNHDGRPDIATVNLGDSTVSVLFNTTKFPTPPRQKH